METYEICLEKLELVNSYVDTFERRAALTKEYSQKIEEASIAQRRFGSNISASEILNEFMRVSDMMFEQTKKIYQHQYDIAYNDFRKSIDQLTSEISKNSYSLLEDKRPNKWRITSIPSKFTDKS